MLLKDDDLLLVQFTMWTIVILTCSILNITCQRQRGNAREVKEKEVQNERLEQFLSDNSYNALSRPLSDNGAGFSEQGTIQAKMIDQ